MQDVQDESISCWFNSSKDSLSFEAFGFYYPKKVEVLVEYISTTYDEDSQIPLKCSVVFYDDNSWKVLAKESFNGVIKIDDTLYAGTYTGNPLEAGSVTMLLLQANEGEGLQDLPAEEQSTTEGNVDANGNINIDGIGKFTRKSKKSEAVAKYDSSNFALLGKVMKAALIFYKDSSYELVICPKGSATMTCASGTYTGNPKISGEITLTVKKGLDFETKILKNQKGSASESFMIDGETLNMSELGTYTRTFPGKEPEPIAKFSAKIELGSGVEVEYTFIFYENKTVSLIFVDSSGTEVMDKYTYTGDPTKDGKIQIKTNTNEMIGTVNGNELSFDDDMVFSRIAL